MDQTTRTMKNIIRKMIWRWTAEFMRFLYINARWKVNLRVLPLLFQFPLLLGRKMPPNSEQCSLLQFSFCNSGVGQWHNRETCTLRQMENSAQGLSVFRSTGDLFASF